MAHQMIETVIKALGAAILRADVDIGEVRKAKHAYAAMMVAMHAKADMRRNGGRQCG